MQTNTTNIDNTTTNNKWRTISSEVTSWKVQKIADELAVSIKTIKRLIDEGVLPVVRIRGCIRVPKQAVLDWVENQTRYNWGCAGLVVRNPKGERKCLNSARKGKALNADRVPSSGGPLTPTQAVKEFNALLGQPTRGKR